MNIKFKRIREYLISNNPKDVFLIFVLVVIICIFVFPWLFTRNWLLGEWFHFNNTGQIGDTIGGTISPL